MNILLQTLRPTRGWSVSGALRSAANRNTRSFFGNCSCTLSRVPQTVFSVCQSWASPLWLAVQLLKAGDIESNPGPPRTHRPPKSTWICNICHRPINTNQYSYLCHHTNSHWVHKRCTTTPLAHYNNITWTCPLHKTTNPIIWWWSRPAPSSVRKLGPRTAPGSRQGILPQA